VEITELEAEYSSELFQR